MKHLFIVSAFVLLNIGVFAQQRKAPTSEKKTDSLNKNVSPDSIVLSTELKIDKKAKPEFNKSSLQMKKEGKAASQSLYRLPIPPDDPSDPGDPPIDPPIDPDPPVYPPLGASSDAGRTPSKLDVSGSGASTFTVPIALPPGLGSTEPHIAFSYNSQSGNGIGGVGWSISGLSAISRRPSTSFHENKIKEVAFDAYDQFSMDGQRLLLKSGTFGADGAEYQTENYSNVRIFARGVSPYGASYGPEHFEVWLPDGTKVFYGQNYNSRTTNDYAITYSESPLGARIVYTYTSHGNTLWISQIGYGGIGSASSINTINFSYTPAHRTEQAYIASESFARSQLLHKVTVIANGVGFRNYNLTYATMSTLYYSRIGSITEYSGDETKALSPIHFSYNSTGDITTSTNITNLSLSGIASNNSEIVTADFTGNGSMDFLLYPKYAKNKFYAFYDLEPGSPWMQMGYEINTGQFRDIFPSTWLTWNTKILPGQGMLLVKDNGPNNYKFDMYSSGTVTPVYYQYDKQWDNAPAGPVYYSDYDGQYHDGVPLERKFVSGDFNGDGLSDLIAINDGNTVYHESSEWYWDPWDDRASYQYPVQQYADMGSSAYFIDMDRRLTSNYIFNLGNLNPSYGTGESLLSGDFNGDGKTDILHVKQGAMYVYTMNAANALELLWATSDFRITNNYISLLGDYNGDGKTDIMFPTGNNYYFATFMSTGKSFTKYEQNMPFENPAGSWNGTNLVLPFTIATDVNGDGKTDIIRSQTVTQNNSNYGQTTVTVNHNLDMSFYGPQFSSGSSITIYGPLKHYPIPIFMSPDRVNQKLEFGFLSNNGIALYKFQKDYKTEALLSGISQEGVYHNVEYKKLAPDDSYSEVPIYQISYDQTYPYIDVHSAPTMDVVSKMTRSFNSEQISQLFGYAKAVSHIGGLGFQGFGETIRSNWHQTGGDPNTTYSVSIFDPMKRGALVRSFSTKSTYLNSTIKDFSVTSVPAAAVADGGSINDYISRTDQIYQTSLLPNKVFVSVTLGSANKDMLTNTFSTQTQQYDEYYNITKTSANFNGIGSKITDVTYDNNPSGYYIGRPLTTKTTLAAGSESFVTDDEFSYSGWLLTQAKKRSNGSGWISENMAHDSFGNVTQKTTIAPNSSQRVVSMQYDPTGRFSTQATDSEAMVTSSTFDPSNGNVLSSTNPYGQTKTFTYDAWGRLKTVTDYLNLVSTTSYAQVTGGNIITTEEDDEGRSNVRTINALGQLLETKGKNVLGQYIGKGFQYDVYGRQVGESQPAQPGNYTQWDQTGFDEYGRVKQQSSYTGKITNISYSGMSITASDGVKTLVTTKNALGQVIGHQDGGGSISFSYFANGNMKTADYGGMVQTIEQDPWGRKTKLTDPSAGEYQYQYDSWGQLTKEINPKGFTEYIYSPTGKLAQKKLVGDDTNIELSYTYDPATKLLTSMSLVNTDGNNATYTYSYDSDKRLTSKIEDNTHARFLKGYTYDGYGRISTESYEAKNKANNITAQKTIELQYAYGEPFKTTLQGTGQILWEVSSLTSKGELAEARQGSALKNILQYDSYGLPQQQKVNNISSNATLMQLNYVFDAQRGILNSRSNSAFSWNETFAYDNLDRLTDFNDNLGSNSQAYDNRGRITTNSQLGTYSYNSGSYQQSELDLSNNATANTYYQTQHALQHISYNSFKSPVEIFEDGKERISFQYNAALGRSHMYYGDTQVVKELRRYRRHYAEDGAMEITNDSQTGKTNFVFYLGGDAYNAPAIWKEEHTSSASAGNLYYLHRDHLGSIVMITDDQGTVVEKRQFDAWGNIVQLTDGSGNPLAAFGIIDRGFTGHEHLLGVGLIHMNGRLYDPRLHRFLSPDNYVQDLYNTQNYNRYGYGMNNPLTHIDPSGEIIWAIVGVMALVGAISGGTAYIGNAIKTGNWSWGGFGMSLLGGAVIGGITGGINPMAIFSVGSLAGVAATGFASGFLPSANVSIGDFSFSVSPAIAFGQSFGFGANFSASYDDGNFSISAGIGAMFYNNYHGFGAKGSEIRSSIMAAYGDKDTRLSLGTNFWRSDDGMSTFNQRTGSIGWRNHDFGILYENDGGAGIKHLRLGDRGDSYRTAALNLSYKEYTIGFNLFTGNRSKKNQDWEDDHMKILNDKGKKVFEVVDNVDSYGAKFKRDYVNETGTPYRLGALTVGMGNYRLGTNSEHVRHAIQDRVIHGFIGDAGFRNMSWGWGVYSGYKTRNAYSSW